MTLETNLPPKPKRGRPKLIKPVSLVAPEWRSTAHALDVLATIAFPVSFGSESDVPESDDAGDTTLYLPDPYSDRKVELLESIAKTYGLKCRRGKRTKQVPSSIPAPSGIQRWRPLTLSGPRHLREVVTATYEYSVAHASDLVQEVLPTRPVDMHKRVFLNNWWDGYNNAISPLVSSAIKSAKARSHVTGAKEQLALSAGKETNHRVKPKGPSHARKILPDAVPVLPEPPEVLLTA